jgi:hypothetical protein
MYARGASLVSWEKIMFVRLNLGEQLKRNFTEKCWQMAE